MNESLLLLITTCAFGLLAAYFWGEFKRKRDEVEVLKRSLEHAGYWVSRVGTYSEPIEEGETTPPAWARAQSWLETGD